MNPEPATSWHLRGGTALLPGPGNDSQWQRADLAIDNSAIAQVRKPGETLSSAGSTSFFDGTDCLIVPGLIDLHVNGGGGGCFDLGTVEDFRRALEFHAAGGTTCLLPTLNTAPEEIRARALRTARALMEEQSADPRPLPEILGMYLEGPYYSYERRGAHPPEFLREPAPADYGPLLDEFGDLVRVFSLAPELPGALELIRELRKRNILAACGHSDADYPQLRAAMDAGLSLITHFYCAHSEFHRIGSEKHLGVAEAGLMHDELDVEVIPDGKHTTAELVRLILHCKPDQAICLTTDCMPAAGLGIGEYTFLGQEMYITEEVAYRPDRKRYAGSVITMSKALRFMTREVGVPMERAVEMGSRVPARILGLDHRKGLLRVGFDADLTVLNEDVDVLATFSRGRLAYLADTGRVD